FSSDGLIDDQGVERAVDLVVTATGFKAADYLSTFDVVGRGGKTLQESWKRLGGPEAFVGTAVAGFPNFFILYGPNTNSSSNSIMFVLETQAAYLARNIRAMKRRRIASVEISERAQRTYNKWLHRKMGRTT